MKNMLIALAMMSMAMWGQAPTPNSQRQATPSGCALCSPKQLQKAIQEGIEKAKPKPTPRRPATTTANRTVAPPTPQLTLTFDQAMRLLEAAKSPAPPSQPCCQSSNAFDKYMQLLITEKEEQKNQPAPTPLTISYARITDPIRDELRAGFSQMAGLQNTQIKNQGTLIATEESNGRRLGQIGKNTGSISRWTKINTGVTAAGFIVTGLELNGIRRNTKTTANELNDTNKKLDGIAMGING